MRSFSINVELIAWILITSFYSSAADDATNECKESIEMSDLNSYLWQMKISTEHPPSYLFGTIHVPYTQVWDFIPENTKQAFQETDNSFFELDMTEPETILALARCQLLPNNQNLRDHLPKMLYRRLKKHMKYIKTSLKTELKALHDGVSSTLTNTLRQQLRTITTTWQRMRPIWLALTLNSLSQNQLHSLAVPVLDLYLARQAVRLGKTTGAVEEVSEQCDPLNSMSQEMVEYLLEEILSEQEKMKFNSGSMQSEQLTQQYKCGNLDASLITYRPVVENTSKAANISARVDNYFRKEFLLKRNKVMASRIKQLIEVYSDESFFFALGAGYFRVVPSMIGIFSFEGHFIGQDSVLSLLEYAGVTIQHVSAGSTLPDYNLIVVNDTNKVRHKNSKKMRRHKNACENSTYSAEKYLNFTKLWNRMEISVTTLSYTEAQRTNSASKLFKKFHCNLLIAFVILFHSPIL